MKLITKISLVLLRPLSPLTLEVLKAPVRVKAKGKENAEEASERCSGERIKKENALQQVSALLSFKEDFGSGEYFNRATAFISKMPTVLVESFLKGLLLVVHKALERNSFDGTRSVEDAKSIELVLKVIRYQMPFLSFLYSLVS